ncbi:GlsB/YeaQ/YmgE family stress response membrane protein [Nitratidesulfovibrio liaohensis]|uniref:GlsB/YeaQ/YmgE family stress response membrane protein n=1 Tax=Nitratidesulfovibrio liaohensis TaxID=2604158 RepID=A0ABY9R159_9BACT|nr:GlsB/YeaQ/YmgE family stress response membrane protein [Nitratidesulfovibrio liaohensis]WMW65194.1 GlsB/YeaQ/YmgE family stress response membrane protein [Nitratidesulfovibrio liaohensis]
MSIIWFLLLGALAGWLAANLMQGRGFGFLGNMAVGVVGAVLGGFLFRMVGVHGGGMMGSLVTAVVGAIVLLFLVGLIKRN